MDNGQFADKGWVDNFAAHGQTLSFCGVNAHHQNGVAKKRIRDLQEAVRAALIHAKQRWLEAIKTSLWPYALSIRLTCTEPHAKSTDERGTDCPLLAE